MIGIFLRDDQTQVVKAMRRKNALHVIAAERLPPYLEYVQKQDAGFLVDLFQAVNQAVGSLYEEIYIVLPDGEFDFIDCADFSEVDMSEGMEEAHEKWLADRNIKRGAHYVSYPIEYRTNLHHMKTSVGIARDKVDCLLAAAKAADASLMSVEPVSLAYLRCLGKWREEHCILEFVGGNANLLAYSPLGGLFRLPMPQISKMQEVGGAKLWEEAIDDALVQYDAVRQKSFEYANIDAPLHVISSMDLTGLKSVRRRLATPAFPDTLVKTGLPPEARRDYMIPIGAALQVFEGEAFFEENLPGFLRLTSANVLPGDVKLDSRFSRLKKKTLQYSKRLIGVLLVALAIEGGGILYFSSIQIPDQLQGNYNHANASVAAVKKELDIIKQAKGEHQYPLEGLEALIRAKPKEIDFLNLELGRAGSSGAWITLNMGAADPMHFREYAAKLNENTVFSGINISQISSERQSGLKTATIEIGRGKEVSK